MEHFVQTGGKIGTQIARLTGAAAHETLCGGGGHNHQRDADTGQQSPDRVNRNGHAHQHQQANEIASRTGDNRAPHIAHRVHVRLHTLYQKPRWVALMKGTVLLHHAFQQIQAHVSGGLLGDLGQQDFLNNPGNRAQNKDGHQHQTNPF